MSDYITLCVMLVMNCLAFVILVIYISKSILTQKMVLEQIRTLSYKIEDINFMLGNIDNDIFSIKNAQDRRLEVER